MTDHTIKRTRAIRLARNGGTHVVHATAAADRIPLPLWDSLTATQLADVIGVSVAAHQGGQRKAVRDVIAEGAIWDERRGILREISDVDWLGRRTAPLDGTRDRVAS